MPRVVDWPSQGSHSDGLFLSEELSELLCPARKRANVIPKS
jgi:hypothetical protein